MDRLADAAMIDSLEKCLHAYVHDMQVQFKDPTFTHTRIALHSDIDSLANLARRLLREVRR